MRRRPAAAAGSRTPRATWSTARSCSWPSAAPATCSTAPASRVTGPNLDAAFRQSRAGRLPARHDPRHGAPADPPSRQPAGVDARRARHGRRRLGRRLLRGRRRRPGRARTPAPWPPIGGTADQEEGRGQERHARHPGRPQRPARLPGRAAPPRPPGTADRRLAQQVLDAARHRHRRARRQRQGPGRHGGRPRRSSVTSSPASTCSSARSPATTRPACRARSP